MFTFMICYQVLVEIEFLFFLVYFGVSDSLVTYVKGIPPLLNFYLAVLLRHLLLLPKKYITR
jgi:hypothetical protein